MVCYRMDSTIVIIWCISLDICGQLFVHVSRRLAVAQWLPHCRVCGLHESPHLELLQIDTRVPSWRCRLRKWHADCVCELWRSNHVYYFDVSQDRPCFIVTTVLILEITAYITCLPNVGSYGESVREGGKRA